MNSTNQKAVRMKGAANTKVIIIALASVASLVIVGLGMKWHYQNLNQSLRNQAKAQEDVCKLVYDETWKIISQKAQVADQYKTAFKEIFPSLMEGRYGNERGGALMSFIHEHNPSFDASLYKDVMNSIEAQRHKWTDAQKMLRDIKLQHDNIRTTVPGSWFVGGVEELKVTLVTSTRTGEVYKTGVDDDVSVFPKKPE
jgi:hypothetical protein